MTTWIPAASRARRIATCACLSALVLVPAGAGAQDVPPQQPAAPSVHLVELNQGIKAFLDADYARAREIFERILSEDADNAVCLYYLGLIYLDDGLKLAAEDDRSAARARFDQARAHLERVTELADPTVTPIEAALLLGIAQLAADVPAEAGTVLEATTRARDTLQRYVETVDAGKNDRYGYFYLGVAYYRLGDQYAKSGDYARAGEQLEAAVKHLATALSLARVDLERGRTAPQDPRALDQERFERFERVVSYYQGLVDLQRRDNRAARSKLQFVLAGEEKTRLGNNAGAILKKLDEMETEYPLPLSVPTPLGRLDVQGDIAIGGVYDTNVILLGRDTALPLNIGHKYDFGFGLQSGFSVSRYLSKTEAPVGESLSFGIGGRTEHTWYSAIHEFDLNAYSGQAFVNWQPVPDVYLGLEYDYSYTMLGHDPFISGNRLTPVVSRIWRKAPGAGGTMGEEAGRTDVWYNYDYRNYLERIGDPRFNRDGKYQSVGVRHTFNLLKSADLWPGYYAAHEQERRYFGRRWLSLGLGYVFRDERTRGSEFDLAGHSILAGVEVPLPYRLSLEFEAVLTWEDYAAPSIFDYRRNERSDFVQGYNVGLTHTFVARGENSTLPTLEVKLRGGVGLTFQNSNIWDRLSQDIYEYNRAIYGLQLKVSF